MACTPIVRRIAAPGLARPPHPIEGSPQGPRGFSWIRRHEDRAGHRHPGRAGAYDLACILRINPALREYGEAASCRGPEGREAERRPSCGLRNRRKNRGQLHVARGSLARRKRLRRCVAGSPDPGIGAQKPARLGGTHPIEAEMHAIDPVLGRRVHPGPKSERYIGAPIHDDAHTGGSSLAAGRSSAPRRPRDALRKLEERSSREILLTDLHPVNAMRNRLRNHLLEGTAAKRAIRHETKDGPGGCRQG